MFTATRHSTRVPGSGRRASAWCAALACLFGLLLALVPGLRAEEPAVDGLFLTVQNPITSNVTNRLKETTTRAVDHFRAGEPNRPGREARVFKIVYDFNPDDHPAGSEDYGACYELAKFLLSLQDVTTIAFVHNEVTRHTVLPVLACKEIVMSKDAKLGSVLPDANPQLAPSELVAYQYVAKGRGLNPAIVLKVLDKDMVVIEGRTRQGSVWYLDAREKPEEGVIVVNREPVLSAGKQSTLYDTAQAQKFGLCRLVKETRQEVAEAYQMPPASLREDPLMGRKPVAWRVEVKGEVTRALQETLERRIRHAVGQHANLLIVELHCGGGETQAARDLAEFLRTLKDDKGDRPVMTVAYIPDHAPDTAVFVALGCTEIVMNRKADIGDFSNVVTERRGADKVDVDPAQYRLKMESLMGLAEAQGYSPLLVRGMMDRHVAIYSAKARNSAERRLITGEELEADKQEAEKKHEDPKWGHTRLVKKGGPDGEYLILKGEDPDKDDAQKLGLARHVVDDLHGVYTEYGVNPEEIHDARADWLDEFASFLRHPLMAVFLVMFGITCLILELKIPGVGLPGVVAALCFVLFFWAHSQFAGQVTMLAVLLFVLGLILIALEIFVLPGLGVAGISGIILVVGSLGLVAYGHWPQTSDEWVGFGRTLGPFGLSLLGAVVSAFVLARYLPNIPYVNRLMLRPQTEETDLLGEAVASPLHPDYSALLGAIGVAATPLRPAGKVQFGDDYVDVIAEGSYVVAGTRVQVIEIEGNRVVVKEV